MMEAFLTPRWSRRKGRVMDHRDLMSVREAAGQLGVSRQRVYELLRRGILVGRTVGGIQLVSRPAVRSRAARRALK